MSIDYKKLIVSMETFYNDLTQVENHRYRSWEYCYKSFVEARKNKENNIDYLALQLAFYLASWGMYRGSSFLLQKDYKIHIPIVEEILKPEYDCLLDLDCSNLINNKNIQDCLENLNKKLKDYYRNIRSSIIENDVKQDISSILISKILLGALGCVPAYDRFFMDGVKLEKVTTANYNLRSLIKLAEFYQQYREQFEEIRKKMVVGNLEYPQMKLLDMCFWQIGFENSTKD